MENIKFNELIAGLPPYINVSLQLTVAKRILIYTLTVDQLFKNLYYFYSEREYSYCVFEMLKNFNIKDFWGWMQCTFVSRYKFSEEPYHLLVGTFKQEVPVYQIMRLHPSGGTLYYPLYEIQPPNRS